jgi:riboflavin synthase
MFTGIIENTAEVVNLQFEGSNLNITLDCPLAAQFKVDQSIAHNGVCLTVVAINENKYTVTAIEETLAKTNLGSIELGDLLNIERAMLMNGRLDGHIVQGHVDQIATCVEVKENEGSWIFTFNYDSTTGNVTIEKGSICINGVSLTVIDSLNDRFSVAIIPYTYENTGFHQFQLGSIVNLEFDVIGKYVKRLLNV